MIGKNMVLCLDNNDKYMVLDDAVYEGKNYLYTVKVDDSLIKVLGKYSFFENKNDSVLEIDDESLNSKLYDLFMQKYLQYWGE